MRLSKSSCVSAAFLAMAGTAFAADTAEAADCEVGPRGTPHGHVVVDVASGDVLSISGNLNTRFHPASLTKIMSTYVILEAFENNWLNPNQMITIRGDSAGDADRAMVGRSMTIQEGMNRSPASPNALYQTISNIYPGGRTAFIERMNFHARRMGAENTNFANVNGLNRLGSFGCTNHYTTPLDMMRIFDRAYHHYPNQLHSIFGGSIINTNDGRTEALYPTSALQRRQDDIRIAYNIEIDEIKTGFIGFSGAHLFASARLGQRRFYVLQFGDESGPCRADPSFRVRDCNVLNHLLALDGRQMTSRLPNFNTASNQYYRETATENGSVRMTWTATPVSIRPASGNEILPPITSIQLPTRVDENTLRLWDGTLVTRGSSDRIANSPSSLTAQQEVRPMPVSSLTPTPIS